MCEECAELAMRGETVWTIERTRQQLVAEVDRLLSQDRAKQRMIEELEAERDREHARATEWQHKYWNRWQSENIGFRQWRETARRMAKHARMRRMEAERWKSLAIKWGNGTDELGVRDE